MRIKYAIIAALVTVMAAGCATTKITNREQLVAGPLPKPADIWVYDFAATPKDIPADSEFAGKFESAPQTDEEIATGRRLGGLIAVDLVKRIDAMGMSAKHADTSSKPQVNDLVLKGYLISSEEGKTARRAIIGLGAGNTQLQVAAEGFQVTPSGLRKLGYGQSEATGNKTPGVGVGAATWAITGSPVGFIAASAMKHTAKRAAKASWKGGQIRPQRKSPTYSRSVSRSRAGSNKIQRQ